jgi:hypothetical protein
MTNEQILAEFQKIAQNELTQARTQYEVRLEQLSTETKVKRTAPKWNLNTSVIITDVTPEGYGI